MNTSKDKVLIFLPDFSGGGAERVLVNLANYMYQQGLRVSIVVRVSDGPNKKLVNSNIDIIELGADSLLGCIPLLRHEICKIDPEFVFTSVIRANIILTLAHITTPGRKKRRLILREANVLPARALTLKEKTIIKIAGICYRNASVLFCNSPDTASDVINFYNSNLESKIRIVGNPVIDNKVTQSENRISTMPRSSSCLKILSLGRLVEQKNYEFALEVIALLKSRGLNPIYTICGVGELEGKLKKISHELGLDENVFFSGYQDNVSEQFAKNDVFLLTSLWEGFGNVLVEALATGIPIVATKSRGGPLYIMNHEDYGSLVPFEADVVANSIMKEVDSNNISKLQARVARANEFTLEKIGREYLKVILRSK